MQIRTQAPRELKNADSLSAIAEKTHYAMPAPIFSGSLVLPQCCVHINLKWLGVFGTISTLNCFFHHSKQFLFHWIPKIIVFQRFQKNWHKRFYF